MFVLTHVLRGSTHGLHETGIIYRTAQTEIGEFDDVAIFILQQDIFRLNKLLGRSIDRVPSNLYGQCLGCAYRVSLQPFALNNFGFAPH